MNYFTFTNFVKAFTTILDVGIMWILIYYLLRIVKNNSRTIQIFKGIVFILIAKSLASLLNLSSVLWLVDNFINWGFLAVIVIFQPEIRSILERLGKTNVLSTLTTLSSNEKGKLVEELMKSVKELSLTRTGALITLEQSISLADYIKTGTVMNSIVSSDLLTSLFITTTPLHDGAVILQGDKIACASAYFPPTNLDTPSRYGARHRA
ncbi:MAG: diadenylate cyclase CdaA, partial [Erysipelotrichaceae bacterium]